MNREAMSKQDVFWILSCFLGLSLPEDPANQLCVQRQPANPAGRYRLCLTCVARSTVGPRLRCCFRRALVWNFGFKILARASYQCVLRFFDSACLNYCACHEKVMPGHAKCCNHLSKPEDLMLQNANPLRKSAPGPPNTSDEHVSCTAPATQNASLQILFECPTPAMVFGNVTKLSRFAHFWQGAQSLAPATRNNIWTSKSGPDPWCF